MNKIMVAVLLSIVGVGHTLLFASQTSEKGGKPRDNDTFFLVHGMTGGGWDWQIVDQLLSARGAYVNRVTLTGLGERVHLANPAIGLDTHISDVENAIAFENKDNVILVGHSYGGMVISGVMDRIPEHISHAIFLDAIVPKDGTSVADLRPDLLKNRVVDGMIYPEWVRSGTGRPRDVPQSLKTLTDRVSFSHPKVTNIPSTLVIFSKNRKERELRAVNDQSWHTAEARGWTIRHLQSDHNAQRSHPEALVKLLFEIVE